MKTLFCIELHNSLRFLLGILAPFLGCLAMFATYIYIDSSHVLTMDKAFISLQLFNLIQYPITMIGVLKSQITNAWTSLRRIQNFMDHNLDTPKVFYEKDFDDNKFAIKMTNVTFGRVGEKVNLFNNINFSIPKGSLVAITGPTGCGKTSFMSAIIGAMDIKSGSIHRYGKMGCVLQQPWLFQGTLEENILFGKPLDVMKYKKVVEACELQDDIKSFTQQDWTQINENGINLSGGQKHRICIARVAYSDAEIILMDDPLSALDNHVANNVFRNIISNEGIMANRTRIVGVSNSTFLSAMDYVISFDNNDHSHVTFQTKE